MVIGKVGGSFGSIKKMLDTLQENHYEADVIWMDVPFDVSIKRNIDRYKSGKIKSKQSQRFVPVEVSTDADKGIADTFTQMYNHPIVKTGTIYSNDVPVGVPPKMLHSFKKIK